MRQKEVFKQLFKERTEELLRSKREQGSKRTQSEDIVKIADIIVQSDLRPTTKMAVLYLLLKEGSPVFQTSIRKLQKQTGLSFSSVKRMFAELKEKGVIVEQSMKGSVFNLNIIVEK